MSVQQVYSAPADFSVNPIAIIPPTIAGLASWAFFGSAAGDNTNQVPGGPAITTHVGAPDYFPGYAHFVSGSKSLDTGIADGLANQPSTFLIAGRQQTTGQAVFIGSSDTSSVTKGFYFGINGPNAQAYGIGVQLVNNPPPSTAVWHLYAYVMAAVGQKSRVYNLTDGTPYVEAGGTSTTYTPNTGNNILLGSNTAGTFNSGCDMAFAAAYPGVALSQGQINSLVPSIRNSLAQRGITV